MIRITLLLLLAAAMPNVVAADKGDAPTLGHEARADVLRGHFTQHKHLDKLDQPLVSRGRYVVARKHGLLWQVKKPMRSSLVITPEALTESSNGRQTNRISADKQPALGAVASILLAVFQGNSQQLSRYFNIEHSTRADNAETLVLTPKTDAVRRFIKRLSVSGDDAIRRIRIDQPGGDYSVIELDPEDSTDKSLDEHERRAFSQ